MPLTIRILPAESLAAKDREQIFAMCARAYGEDVRASYETFAERMHVIGSIGDRIVTHALRVTRWLAPDGREPLRTAYIELVATDPLHQRRGYATQLMDAVVAESHDFDLAALAPSDEGLALYQRLGWVIWEGPLLIRRGSALIPTPGELVMIQRLPRSPKLDVHSSLSAEWREGEVW